MASRLNPYLSFKTTAGPAMAFYKSVFGGELTTSTFAELGGSKDPAGPKVVGAMIDVFALKNSAQSLCVTFPAWHTPIT